MELAVGGELLDEGVIPFIDDLLVYANNEDKLLMKLDKLFKRLDDFGLKLSAKKSMHYTKQVKWCGKIIDGTGVQQDPIRLQTIKDTPEPINAGQLQQFICSINWFRSHLFNYASIVKPLTKLLEETLKGGKRTKRVALNIPIKLNQNEKEAFANVKELVQKAM